jgi:hypothetical protein
MPQMPQMPPTLHAQSSYFSYNLEIMYVVRRALINMARNEAKTYALGRAGCWVLVLAREHWWRSVSMSGFARKRGSNIRRSGEHRAFGVPMNENCTLWTLTSPRFESVFFASFLCR